LARKRANDREAQRNIRQRTKEHIENLERKVKEMEGGGRSSSMERVLKRNLELEEEIEMLKEQLAQQRLSVSPAHSHSHSAGNISEELVAQKIDPDWMPETEPSSSPWPAVDLPSHIPAMIPNEVPILNPTFPANSQVFGRTSGDYDDSEDSQQLYTPTATPVWDDIMMFGQKSSQSLANPTPAWTPFHPALSQPSRFADLQPSGFSEVINTDTPPYNNTSCWQSQPSVYAVQISTKLKAPVTHVDHLMISVIHSQRHLHMTSELSGKNIIGPEFLSVHVVLNQPGPLKPPSTLAEVMDRYSAVLSNRGFALIPERLGSFMCMYRFVQWQIQPNYATYQALHDWQAPRPAQLMIAHPAWMDLPPWPKFREKIIGDQERYGSAQFQNDYARNLSLNFPLDPMQALVFEEGQIKVSKMMESHLSNLANMSMKKPFAEKYPEFSDVCRFDEV
jgi:hypothetical protein